MHDLGLILTDKEMTALFRHFDTDRSGLVAFDEFMVGLRGELPEARQALLLLAFSQVAGPSAIARAVGGNARVPLDRLLEAFDPSADPQVTAGLKTPLQVRHVCFPAICLGIRC